MPPSASMSEMEDAYQSDKTTSPFYFSMLIKVLD